MATFTFNLSDITKHLDRETGDPTSGPYITAQNIKDSFQELSITQAQPVIRNIQDEITRVDTAQQARVPASAFTQAGDLLIGTGAGVYGALRSSATTGDVLTVTGTGTVGWSNDLSTLSASLGTLQTTLNGHTADLNTINGTWLPRIAAVELLAGNTEGKLVTTDSNLTTEKNRINEVLTGLGMTLPLPNGHVSYEARLTAVQATASGATTTAGNAANLVTQMGTRVGALETWRNQDVDPALTDLDRDVTALEEFIHVDDQSGVQVGGINVSLVGHLALVEQDLAADKADLLAFKNTVSLSYAPLADFTPVKTAVGDGTAGLVKDVQVLQGQMTDKAENQDLTTLQGVVSGQAATIAALQTTVNSLVAYIKNTSGADAAAIVAYLRALP